MVNEGVPILSDSDGGAVTIVIVIFIIVMLILAARGSSRRCEICGNYIKNRYYIWHLNGYDRIVCPYCNSKLERRRSNRALGGKKVYPPIKFAIQPKGYKPPKPPPKPPPKH